MPRIVVIAFYKFVTLDDAPAMRERLLKLCQEHGVRGTILLAEEGINSTISGTREAIDAVMAYLRSDPRLADLESKESYCEDPPFGRLKIKIKKEIVTLRAPEADPTKTVGRYVNSSEWNALLEDPEVVLIDTRNDYEVSEGTFMGAIDPKTTSFGEFPAWVKENLEPTKHKKVAMFCTGGIRCEKATALLLAHGFENVYHLKGGILKYLEEVPVAESKFEGGCFIFDEREAIEHGLAPKVAGGFEPVIPVNRDRKRGMNSSN